MHDAEDEVELLPLRWDLGLSPRDFSAPFAGNSDDESSSDE